MEKNRFLVPLMWYINLIFLLFLSGCSSKPLVIGDFSCKYVTKPLIDSRRDIDEEESFRYNLVHKLDGAVGQMRCSFWEFL